MRTRRAVSSRRSFPLRTFMLSGVLLVTALVALWQRYRTRRSKSEARQPEAAPLPGPPPRVSIIVPMRNEAAHIDACLASLCAQDYPNFEILVIDDASSDETPQRLAEWTRRDPRVRAHRIDRLPAGWAGKTYAMHSGVLLTRGEWILFTDADTRHSPEALRVMMGHALRNRTDLLSLLPNVMTLSGPAMPLLWPVTAILLAHRMTPAEIRDPASPRAFGFGQYILLRRARYLASGGYDAPGMRTTAVDDLALAEHIKQTGGQIEVVDGRGLLKNLQWTTWQSARQGWVKSCYSEIIRDNLLLVTLPGALAFFAYGLIPIGWLLYALARGKARRFSTLLALITVLTQIETKRRVDREYELPVFWSLAAPLSWAVCGVMLLDVTRLLLLRRQATWKGRLIPAQEQAVRPGRKHSPNIALLLFFKEMQSHNGKVSPGGSDVAEEGASERA
jgi:chlorobactene glucosyltransferase